MININLFSINIIKKRSIDRIKRWNDLKYGKCKLNLTILH